MFELAGHQVPGEPVVCQKSGDDEGTTPTTFR
jgi:hypothetical protein